MIRTGCIAFLACIASLGPLATVPAAAQALGSSSLKNLDSKAPIDVDADRIEVLDKESQAIFTGNVRMTQSTMTLEAQRIRVTYTRPKTGDPVISRLDADGNVKLATPSERGTSRFGIYDVEKRVLTLIGNVQLTQGVNKAQGNRLTIDLDSGRSTLDGKSSSGSQTGGRVSGRFTVPEKKK